MGLLGGDGEARSKKKKGQLTIQSRKKMEDEADDDLGMMLVVREDGFQQQQGL